MGTKRVAGLALAGFLAGAWAGAAQALTVTDLGHAEAPSSDVSSPPVAVITLANNVGLGDTVAVLVAERLTSTPLPASVTDSHSQSYTCKPALSMGSAVGRMALCFHANSAAMTSGVDTITVTYNSTGLDRAVAAADLGGVNTLDVSDLEGGVTNSTGAITSCTSIVATTCSPTITPSTASEIVIAGIGLASASTATVTAPSGFVQLENNVANATLRLKLDYQIVSSTAALGYAPTVNQTSRGYAAGEWAFNFTVPTTSCHHLLATVGAGC